MRANGTIHGPWAAVVWAGLVMREMRGIATPFMALKSHVKGTGIVYVQHVNVQEIRGQDLG